MNFVVPYCPFDLFRHKGCFMGRLTRLQKSFLVIFAIYCLLGMHYFQQNLGGSGLELPINDVAWIFISLLIGIGLWQITSAKQISFNIITKLFIIAIIIMIVPVVFAKSQLVGQSYPRLIGLFGGFLLFFALQQMRFNTRQVHQLLFFILAAVVIEAVLSLTQYYILPSNNIMGYSKIVNRPYGIFQQPNVTASFLVTGIVLSLYLLSFAKCWHTRALCYTSAFLVSIPTILLLSRTGYISLFLAPLLVLPWAYHQIKNNGNFRILWIWLAFFFTGITIGGVTLELAEHVARDAAQLTNPGGRLPIYQFCWHMFLQKPLLGWGYGGFEVNYLHAYADALSQGLIAAGSDANLNHPHNELLLWGVEGGIIPLIGIGVLGWGILRTIFSQSKLKAMAFIGLLFPILLHTQTEYPFYHSASHWAIFIVLLWYISESTIQIQNYTFSYTFFFRTFALLIPLVTALYMLTTLHTTYLLVQYEKSDPKDLTPLLKVENPMSWITRMEFNVMTYRLQSALYKNDKNEINHYIEWAEKMVQVTPRANIYINWIYALDKLEEKVEAESLFERAKHLYPFDRRLDEIEFGDHQLKAS